MELQVGVKALLKNKEGKYLLARRSLKKYPEAPGAIWDIIGGRIEVGTPLLENLRREIMEETSLELKGEVKLIGAQDILRVPGRHVVRLTYLGEIDGEPKINEENTEWRWFTIEEMKKLNPDELAQYFKELLYKGLFG